MSTLKEVWYGQRSLSEMWWFWNVFVGNILIGIAGGFIAGLIARSMHSWFPVLFLVTLTVLYSVWITVGIFRSARRRGGFWGWLAVILTIIGLINSLSMAIHILPSLAF